MTRQKKHDLPLGLERTRRRFERWRASRKSRSRIPPSLWTTAAKMARQHGINRTARALQLDYHALKKHVEHEAGSAPEINGAGESPFLELVAPVASDHCECVFELEDALRSLSRIPA